MSSFSQPIKVYGWPILAMAGVVGMSLYGTDVFAANEFDGAKTQAILRAVQGEVGHMGKLLSYGIGVAAGTAAGFFILAKQNMMAGAISTVAAIAGVALPSMFASGALI